MIAGYDCTVSSDVDMKSNYEGDVDVGMPTDQSWLTDQRARDGSILSSDYFPLKQSKYFPSVVSISAQPSVKSSSKLTAPLMRRGAGAEGAVGEEGGR